MKKVLIAGLAFLLLFSALSIADQVKTTPVERGELPGFIGYVPDRFIVVLTEEASTIGAVHYGTAAKSGVSSLDMLAAAYNVDYLKPQFAGSRERGITELARNYKVKFDGSYDLETVMDAYAADPMVERVEPIGIHSMYATPNDFYYSYQWHLNQANGHDIDAPEAWNIQTGSSSVIVGILDSGTRYYHPDLGGINASPTNPGASRGNMWINTAELNGSAGVDDDGNGYTDDWIGYDFIESTTSCWTGEDCSTKDNDPRDFNGHGTHTAGIFGMMTNDNYGMCGVAGGWGNGTQTEYGNGVKIMALRMGYSYRYLNQEYGVVLMDAAAEAFYYAADNGAKIASCSWGSSNSGGISTAATYFINSGGIICVAAGNDGAEMAADYLNGRGDCISVAATDENDNGASFTTYGTWVDICAPGNNIYSTYHDHADPNTNYWAAMGGTSMATPMVAGTVALIWSQNPGWTAAQVKSQLYSSADNIDAYLSSQYIGKMGAGRINAYNAVNTGPPPAPVANFSGSPTSGTAPLTVNFTDLSTGSIISWSWTFGDGGNSTAQNPSHQYTSAGTYTVSLTVTGPGGSDGETKTNYITVNPCVPPTAGFVGSPTSGDYPLYVSFTNQSSGATSYSWTFGDGGTSSTQNPFHTYTAAGTYTVTLTATNSCGSDGETKTNYITVTEPGPGDWTVITYDDFEGGMGNYTIGGSDCIRYTGGTYAHQGSAAVDIQDNSGTASSFYHTAGQDVSGFTDLEVDFWFYAVSMDNTSEDFWVQYYDGSTWQTVASYARTTDFDNSVFYHKVVNIPGGTYTYPVNAKLRFMCDASGNADDVYIDEIEFRGFGTVVPVPPTAAFVGSPTSGIFPLQVSFTDQSTESPTSWSWTFGDGGTSTAQNPSHTYTAAGTYTVTLTATNAAGSDDEVKTNYITVTSPPPPTAAFVGDPTSGLVPLTVNFTDQSAGAPSSWSWTFGDGGTSTAQNPSHVYSTAGTYTVSLTATNAYGNDVETKTDYITVSEGGGWTIITYDDFEGGWGSYTDGGGDCSRYIGGTYAHQGSAAADIQDNSGTASSFYHTATYNVSGYAVLEVDFWFYAVSMESREDFWVQYYDGSTWRTVASYVSGTNFSNNTFYHEVVTISSSQYTFPTNARLRFVCDASNNTDDVYFDEIEFRGSLTGGSSQPGGPSDLLIARPAPEAFEVMGNYPNPFNPETEIHYSLPNSAPVTLEIFNVIGQRVAILVNEYQSAGYHAVTWNASTVPSGVYFYRITAGQQTVTNKMILMK